MKWILKLEELAMFGLCVCALNLLNQEWWWFLLLVLGPDISMIAYAAGNKIGAFVYNLFHHKGVAVVLFMIGLLANISVLEVTGIVLFGHSSMDRMFGYGLKLNNGFKYTHLGIIGKEK